VKTSIKILGLIACFPLSAGAQSLQCGEKLITQGTTQGEVAARCGQPAHVDRQTLYSEDGAAAPGGPAPRNPLGGPPPGSPVSAPPPGLPGIGGRSGNESAVEIWTYNFGPSRLMQRIRFENGVAVKIESLGYGY
jgi:hypothetical protein